MPPKEQKSKADKAKAAMHSSKGESQERPVLMSLHFAALKKTKNETPPLFIPFRWGGPCERKRASSFVALCFVPL